MNILAEEKNVHRLAYAVCRSVDVSVAQCMDAAKDALRLELNAILSSLGKDGGQEVEAPAPMLQIVGWLYEDELAVSYPYNAMFPFSKVDGVRMFPVYAPSRSDDSAPLVDRLTKAFEEIREHCSNGGIEIGTVGERVAERCEDVARAALADISSTQPASTALVEAARHLLDVGEFCRTDDTEKALRNLRIALHEDNRS